MNVTLLHKISKICRNCIFHNVLLKKINIWFIDSKSSRLDKSFLYHSFQPLSYRVVDCLKGSYPLWTKWGNVPTTIVITHVLITNTSIFLVDIINYQACMASKDGRTLTITKHRSLSVCRTLLLCCNKWANHPSTLFSFFTAISVQCQCFHNRQSIWANTSFIYGNDIVFVWRILSWKTLTK